MKVLHAEAMKVNKYISIEQKVTLDLHLLESALRKMFYELTQYRNKK